MAREVRVTTRNAEFLKEEDPGLPPLDLSDAAIESLLRGDCVTSDEIRLLRSTESAESERFLAKFDAMGVRLMEADAKIEGEARTDEESEEVPEGENGLIELQQPPPLVKSVKKGPVER
jgi:hypothetical protein